MTDEYSFGHFRNFAGRVNLAIAIDHSGRAGNGFFQAIFDQHDEVLTCPWMHYIYSYILTQFGDDASVPSSAAHDLCTRKSYFRMLYNDMTVEMAATIRRFGGDPEAVVDRSKVREVFDCILAAALEISRHDLIVAIYYAYAAGIGRDVGLVKYILTADSISLRTESPYGGFSGRILDNAVRDFPSCRIIQLVRDPRAGFASTNHQFVNSSGNMYGLHWGGFWRTFGRMLRASFDWQDGFIFGFLLAYFYQTYLTIERQKIRFASHFLMVRNEDLNLDFVPTVERLASWLGVGPSRQWRELPYEPTMLGRLWGGTGAYNNAYQTSVHGPLRNDPDDVARTVTGPNAYVTQRWRKRLSLVEIYLIEWFLGGEIEAYGYQAIYPSRCRSVRELLVRLWRPLRGELPTPSWLVAGRHAGLHEMFDRLFYTVTFPIFYIGNRIALLRMIRAGVFGDRR